VSPEDAWKGARCDEDFSDGGRGRGGGDSADGVGGRLWQQADIVDVKVGIRHFGYERSQFGVNFFFFGEGPAD
jgi:hypothetical protein